MRKVSKQCVSFQVLQFFILVHRIIMCMRQCHPLTFAPFCHGCKNKRIALHSLSCISNLSLSREEEKLDGGELEESAKEMEGSTSSHCNCLIISASPIQDDLISLVQVLCWLFSRFSLYCYAFKRLQVPTPIAECMTTQYT